VVAAGMRHINKRERKPAMVYLHPWEVDPEQPRVAASVLTRFRHYVNLDRTLTKLGRLLRAFTFAPVSEILAEPGAIELAA
jgi:hypothetical protein